MSIGSVNVPGSIGAGRVINTNILDNSHFQINQRDGKIVKPNVQYFTDIGLTQQAGITSSYMKVIPAGNVWAISVDGSMYYVSGAHVLNGYIGPGYTLDRWKIVGEGTVILNEDGTITLQASNQEMWFVQYFEQYDNQFNSIEMTGSVLVTRITGDGHALLLHPAGVYGGISGIGIGSYTAVFSEYVEFRIVVPAGCSITIKAAKLEFGSIQTLAHKIGDAWVFNDPLPNKALELEKCQRYFERGSVNSAILPWPGTTFLCGKSFLVEKRTMPAVKIYFIDNSGIYYENRVGNINGDVMDPDVIQTFPGKDGLTAIKLDGELSSIYSYHYAFEASSDI